MIDGHTHLVPEWLRAPGSAAWRDPWFAACHQGAAPRFAAAADVVAELDRAGGGRAVVFGWPFADPGLLAEVNDHVAEEAGRAPDRLTGFAVVNPGDAGATAELERCRSLGLAGLGEINCDGQRFELEWSGALRATILSCAEMGWPVLLHASEPVGHQYPGKGLATPDRLWRLLEPMLAESGELRLCLAHLGGGLPLYAHMPEVARVCRQVWFDTAALPYLYGHRVLEEVAALVGRDRLVLGTDFPLLRSERYRPYLDPISEGAGDLWLEKATAAWAWG